MELLLPIGGAIAILGVLGWAARDDDLGEHRWRASGRQVVVVIVIVVLALALIWVNRKYGNGS